MNMVKLVIRVNLTLVSLREVVDEMEELGFIEPLAEGPSLLISWGQAAEPVVGDDQRWLDLELAEQLQ